MPSLFKNISTNEKITIPEGRLSNSDILPFKKEFCFLHRLIIIKGLDVGFRSNSAINLGQFTHLKATLSQRFQEIIIKFLIGIQTTVISIKQSPWALQSDFECRLGKKFSLHIIVSEVLYPAFNLLFYLI